MAPNIHMGNYDVSASGASFFFSNNTTSQFFFSPRVEYFLSDRFSIGGTGNLTVISGNSYYGIGPSMSYHFVQIDNWVGLFGASGMYNANGNNSDFNYYNVQGRLGIEYFLTPAVSMGPIYTYYHTFKNSNNSVADSSSNAILLNFSVYL